MRNLQTVQALQKIAISTTGRTSTSEINFKKKDQKLINLGHDQNMLGQLGIVHNGYICHLFQGKFRKFRFGEMNSM